MFSLAESTGWCALSVLQSIDVPDLTARDAAPVRRDVHGLAGGRDINRLAEWAGLRRDDGFARWGIHADHLSTVHGASESGERQSNESHNTALYHKQEVTLGNPCGHGSSEQSQRQVAEITSSRQVYGMRAQRTVPD